MARYGYHLWVNTCDHGTSWLCLHHYLGRCVFSIFSGTTNHDPKNPPKMAKQICEFQMNNFTSYKIVFMIKLSSYLLYFILLCLLNQIIFFNYIIDIIYYILYVLYILYILFYIFIYIYISYIQSIPSAWQKEFAILFWVSTAVPAAQELVIRFLAPLAEFWKGWCVYPPYQFISQISKYMQNHVNTISKCKVRCIFLIFFV